MRIDIRRRQAICIVDVTGRLVLGDNEGTLRRRLEALLAQGERRFVLKLDGVSQIDSAGVGQLVGCYKRAAESGAVLKIALGSEGLVRRVFELSGLERALEVFDDEVEAADSFA